MEFHEQNSAKKLTSLNPYQTMVASNDEDSSDLLGINIVKVDAGFQEIEVLYGNKKVRRKIAKFLPANFARFIYATNDVPRPSAKLGVTNLASLSNSQATPHSFLQEKFLRIMVKINQVSELKTAEKIWDSEERISTAEKAILVAVMNRFKSEDERLERLSVSSRSHEISDQNSFKKFISEVLDLTKNNKKLAKVLFGDSIENLSDDKKANLNNCLQNILSETDDTRRNHQMRFLQKFAEGVFDAKTIRQV